MVTFSIITPVLNSEETIRDCIESVRCQTISAQHIIVDGKSTDGTMDIIKSEFFDCTECISGADKGIYDAINKGIDAANGDVIGILNSDDYFLSKNILALASNVFDNTTIQSCYGDLIYVDRKNVKKIVRYWCAGNFTPNRFYNGWMPPHPTFFVKRELYKKYGQFDISLGVASDYELMMRFLLRYGITVKYIPEVLVCMRTGGASGRSIRTRINSILMNYKAWRINSLNPYWWTMMMKPSRKLIQYFKRPHEKVFED